ncbi:hypothetical protein H311_04419 [Anncaliia algerae PRA109]|nr:hypothetical protein H311_04419 [Anncaliia algerae PRA109]
MEKKYEIGDQLSLLYKKSKKEIKGIIEEYTLYIQSKKDFHTFNTECLKRFEVIFFLYKINPKNLQLSTHKINRNYFNNVKKDIIEFFKNYKNTSFSIKEEEYKWLCNLYSKNN